MGIELRKKEKPESLLKMVERRFEAAKSFRAPYEARWLENYRLYRLWKDEQAYTSQNRRADLMVPAIWEQVETIAPRMVASIFASRPFVGVLPHAPIPDEETSYARAQAMELMIDYQLSDRINIKLQAGSWAREACIAGMAPAFVGWRKKIRMVKERVPKYSEADEKVRIGSEPKEKELVIYDDPVIVPIDVFNFYWDPQAVGPECVADARYIIRRSEVSRQYLREQAKLGIFDEKAVEKAIKEGSGEFRGDNGGSQRISDLGNTDIEGDSEEPVIELLEHWEDDRVIVLADRKTLLRAEETPFWHSKKPFVVGKIIPSLFEFSGIDIITAAKSPQYELNDWRNIRLDNAKLRLHTPIIIPDHIEIDAEDFILGPGEVIRVTGGANSLQPWKMEDLGKSGYTEEEVLKNDIQGATGASEIMRGMSPGARVTATETSARVEQGSFRLDDMRATFEATAIIPAVELIGAMNQQFVDTERFIRITGPAGQSVLAQVTPDAIAGEYDYSFLGSSTEPIANKDLHKQQWIQLFGSLVAMPEVDKGEMLKQLLQTFGIRQPERFLMTPEKMAQQQAAMAPPAQPALAQAMPPAAPPQAPAPMPQQGMVPQQGGGIDPAMLQQLLANPQALQQALADPAIAAQLMPILQQMGVV